MDRLTLMLAAFGLTVGAAAAQGVVPPSEVTAEGYGTVAQPLTDAPGNAENGRMIVASKGDGNCIACHAVSDLKEVPFHGEVGPPLDGAGSRWEEGDLRGILVNAKNLFPDTIMPAFYKTEGFVRPGDGFTGKAAQGELEPLLSAQEIEDVVAYLMTLKDE